MKNWRWILLLLFAYFLGCATTYRVSDIRTHAYEMAEVISQSLHEIDKDVQGKSEIVEGLKSNKADFTRYPFNQLEKDLGQLNEIKLQILSNNEELKKHLKNIEELEKHKNKIKKNDQEFAVVTEYKEFADKFKPKVDQLFDDYRNVSASFNKTTNTNQIYMIDTHKINQQMNQLKNQVDRSVKMNSLQMKKIEVEVSKIKEENSEKKKMFLEMKGLIKQIQNEVKSVQSAGMELQKSLPKRGRVVIGPHMKSHSFLLDIKNHGLNIDNLVKRFNHLNDSLKN